MIFNPLFFNEIAADPKMLQNHSKLTGKKYLFTDIVKVVMQQPQDSQNKIDSDLKIPLTLGSENIPVKLESKELSKLDSDNVKQGLAQILPIEIAQLLIDEKITSQDPEPVSYISTDLLNGELKNFVYNLVGPELVEKNITEEHGLLLSLEDNKSAVNIELSKAESESNKANKILVQTLVVPEKSKLFSFLTEGENSALFKVNEGESAQTVKGLSEINNKIPINVESELKPTLSVYAFKYADDEKVNNLGEFTKSNKLGTNLKLLQNKNAIIDKEVNIENKLEELSSKLSKVNFPETKYSKDDSGKSDLLSKIIKVKDNLKSISKTDTGFNVNKITILKKQNSEGSSELSKAKNNGPTELKPINFNSKLNTTAEQVKSELKIVQAENKKEVVNASDNIEQSKRTIKSSGPNEVKTFDLNKITKQQQTSSSKEGNIDLDNKLKSELESKIKITNIKSSNNVEVKSVTKETNEITKTGNEEKTKPEAKIDVQKQTKTVIETKNVENTENITLKSKNTSKNEYKVQNEIKQEIGNKVSQEKNLDTTKINTKSEVKIVNNELDAKELVSKKDYQPSTENSNVKEQVKADNTKQNINTNKSELNANEKRNIEIQNVKSEPELSSNTKEKIKDAGKIVQLQNNENVKNVSPTIAAEIREQKDSKVEKKKRENKKVSVKLKNNVKGIKEGIVNNSSSTETTTVTGNKNSQSNNGDISKQNLNQHTIQNIDTQKANPNFAHVYDRINEQLNNNENIHKTKKSDRPTHFVKSGEVIKEVTKFISKAEAGSLSFDIKPEELGKMKITLDTVDNALKARIEVESEHAKQLIERNMDKLQQELNRNGVQLNSLNISLGNSNKKGYNSGKAGNGKKGEENEIWVEGEIEEKNDEKSMGYNTYEYIA